jgi:hypothetical protein
MQLSTAVEPHQLTASEAAALLRARKLSCAELARFFLKTVNGEKDVHGLLKKGLLF